MQPVHVNSAEVNLTAGRGPRACPRAAFLAGLLALVLGLLSCGEDAVTVSGDDDEGCPPICPPTFPALEVGDPAAFSLEGLVFDVSRDGSVRNGRTVRDPSGNEAELFFVTGLWVAAEVSGQSQGNLIWSGGHDGVSNYVAETVGSDSTARQLGPFVITPDHLKNPGLDWPEGAPVDERGAPRIYGDQMIWSSVVSDTTDRIDEFATPLPGLRVNQSFFAILEEGFENVIFFRWDITNQSDVPWQNVHVGIYSDTDLGFEGSGASSNRAGFSASDGLSYVYSRTASGGQFASGIAFLSTPAKNAPNHFVTSHRILRKNDLAPVEFAEEGFNRPEQILWALQGLSNEGDPMIDPTTGGPTAYAYTGDPSTGEGWIDDSLSDMRNMIGSGAFTLAPGETGTVLGVWLLGWGDSLPQAIGRVRGTLIDARREAYRIVQ